MRTNRKFSSTEKSNNQHLGVKSEPPVISTPFMNLQKAIKEEIQCFPYNNPTESCKFGIGRLATASRRANYNHNQ